jgi:hypothetical protein
MEVYIGRVRYVLWKAEVRPEAEERVERRVYNAA